MFSVLMVVQVLLGLSVIGLVLLQQGKGADMGAAFGSGASGTVFGARGSGSFLTRATAVLAALFFANSILLSSPLVLERDREITSVTELVPETAPAEQDQTPGDLPPVDAPDENAAPADLPPVDTPDEGAAPAEETGSEPIVDEASGEATVVETPADESAGDPAPATE
jgi:preprotein translocase subunit SecG